MLKSRVLGLMRQFMANEGFLEIETPILCKSTPEGARDYLVPSRVHPGNFYALPQSPQLFKQLLMASGYDRYFQIARCFRDEDLRADRQPEFTQADMELSFVDIDDVIDVNERLLNFCSKKYGCGCSASDPENYLAGSYGSFWFRQAGYAFRHKNKIVWNVLGALRLELAEQMGLLDKNEYRFVWITEFPLLEWSDEENRFTAMHHPFTMPMDEDLPLLDTDPGAVRAKAYIVLERH